MPGYDDPILVNVTGVKDCIEFWLNYQGSFFPTFFTFVVDKFRSCYCFLQECVQKVSLVNFGTFLMQT